MSYLDPQRELAARNALAARAKKPEVLGASFPVFTRRVFISSEQDLIKKIGVKVGNKHEYKYLQIEPVGIDDIEGEDDCPGVAITYRFRLFVGFVDSRGGSATYSNSTDEFIALLIQLRNEFSLSDTVLDGDPQITNDALAREDFILIDDDPLTGATGHFIDQLCRVEFF